MIALVAQRELRLRLRSRAFVVFTVLIAVLIIGIGILHRVLSSDDGPSRVSVAVVGTAPSRLAETVLDAATLNDVAVTLVPEPDRGVAEAALRDGDVEAVILAADGSVLFHQSIDTDVERTLDSAWRAASAAQAAQAAGLSAAEAAALVAPTPLRAVTVDPSDDDGAGLLVGFVTAVLLLISVTTFGGYVLTGVVEEKTSAVVELLLARVRARQLLAGKVIGIGLVALMQMVVAVAAGIVALAISGADIPTEIWVSVPMTLLWFVTGFLLYSTLFASGRLVRVSPGGRPSSGGAHLPDLHGRVPHRVHGRGGPRLHGRHGAVAAPAVRPAPDAAAHRHRRGQLVGGGRRDGAARRGDRPRPARRRGDLRADVAPPGLPDHLAQRAAAREKLMPGHVRHRRVRQRVRAALSSSSTLNGPTAVSSAT